MPPVGFEPIIPASERPQTHALDRATTGIGMEIYVLVEENNDFGCLDSVLEMYSYSTTKKMHLFLTLFILVKLSTRFGLSVHHQELKTSPTATGICQTAAATCCYLLLSACNSR